MKCVIRATSDDMFVYDIFGKDEDVVIFEKRFFNPELSSHYNDNYLDDLIIFLLHEHFQEPMQKKC